ncbi:MAG TPA: serine hydrolase [Candidatus Acidoferrum sp.]|nr:serine hydrolase [Candidatus Acidoferrum sp.]
MRAMKRIVALFWKAFLFSLVAGGLSAAQQPNSAEIDSYLRKQMQTRHIPGLQVAVVRHGRIVVLRSYGVANLQTPVPVTNATVFSINSITKAFTGVEAARLAAAGKLDLNAPVSTYLEGLPQAWRSVTIRQLLTHMSGIPDINNAPGITDYNASEASIWAWVQAQPMNFAPGERFDYCQTNYALIQKVINKLKGESEEMPLAGPQIRAAGMTSTRYGDSTEVIENAAAGYHYTYAKPGDPGVLHPVYEVFRPFERSAAGMFSTAQDMARWMIAIQQKGILEAEGRNTLWTPATFNDGRQGEWGLGWQILGPREHPVVGMTGGGRSAFFLYPKDDLGIVILTNLAGSYPEDIMDRIAAMFGVRLTGVPALRAELEKQGFRDGLATAAEFRKKDPASVLSETELNDWGYRLLSSGKQGRALEVFKIVSFLYPQSSNAYDSLGEAYAANGDKANALASYPRSLELDPKNTNAEEWLEKLGGQLKP